ncbi:MAG TPA: DUF5666 domain-containing protein [Candidatus Bathyarchaeia archaeon]|nr:DUF5666 domain-containing protein [Candidatus Bathyarchaeia archaeon]
MSDDTGPFGPRPTDSFESTFPFDPALPAPPPDGKGATFRGRTPAKTQAIRAGIVAGTGLLVAIGAAVAMGASPAPVPTTGANPGASAQPSPGEHGRPGPGWAFTGPGRAFGGPGPAFGGPGPFGGPGGPVGRAFGQIKVTAINGSNVTLQTDDGWTRTIAVTGTTTITKGGQASTLSSLAVGDVIVFGETRNADGSYTITRIEIVVPQFAGTVSAVGTDTITIKGRDGTSTTIRTSTSTTYHLGRSDGSRSDVKVGSEIVASGNKAADGSLDATSVTVLQPLVAGTVTAKTADTITISRGNGTSQTIHVSSATTYHVAGTNGGSLADVTVGMRVFVQGSSRSDGSIDAAAIDAGPFRGNGGHDKNGVGPKTSAAPSASGGISG